MSILKLPARIVLFGDSITQQSFSQELNGWGVQLANLYLRKADIINRGFSGYSSRWALTMLPQILAEWTSDSPALLTIFFGANDAALPNEGRAQHVPLDEYGDNIRKMVDIVRSTFPKCAIIVLAPPPLHEQRFGETCRSWGTVLTRTEAHSAQYTARCVEVANSLQVPCIDLGSLMRAARDDWWEYLSDGLHLTSEGNTFVFSAIKQCIEKFYPQLSADALPLHYPHFADIDNNDHEKMLKQVN